MGRDMKYNMEKTQKLIAIGINNKLAGLLYIK